MTKKIVTPIISEESFIHPSALIIGNVEISRDCSVWPFAVLRGDEEPILISERTNIQDGVIIHSDEGFPVKVGIDVSVGHGAIVHGCTIGDRCIIGIRSTILNGAVIGEGSIIGAGAVVTPGTVIPPFSMVVGIPGKVKREDSTIPETALNNSRIYRELAKKHIEGEFATHTP
ncbi:MAG: gamma carbonic anhydrase family protein [Thermoplasmatota archaeon]